MPNDRPPSAVERDLPGYRIESVLGTGASSTVYRAVQTSLGRYVAIKRFDPASFMPKGIIERFEREAAIWSHLSHENTLHLYDYRTTSDARYIILEYCHGIELKAAIDRVVTFPPTVVASLAHQALTALEYLHRYGVVHRDFKPANIFLSSHGVVKLMDFGISLCPELEPITVPGTVLGTPSYMSPEQATGQEVDDRSDLFSLGVVLYELLEGIKPFAAADLGEMAKNPKYWKFRKLPRNHPSVLRDLVHACLTTKPKKRKVSIPNAKKSLEKFLASRKIFAPKEHLQRFLREKGLVSEEPSLFSREAILETSGPLGTTFAQLFSDRATRTSAFRPWLLAFLTIAILGLAYFGPSYFRPDWTTFGEVLYRWIQSVFSPS